MAIARFDANLLTTQGQAISGASVYVLFQPADTVNFLPLVTLYADAGEAQPKTNPLTTDGNGDAFCYLQAGTYTVCFTSPLITTIVKPDQTVGTTVTNGLNYYNNTVNGPINGVNNVFTLLYPPNPLNSFNLYWNGVRQAGNYTLAGLTLTTNFTIAGQPAYPQPGDTLYATYNF